MNEADALDLIRAAVWAILTASGPALLAAMIVGVVIAFIQALTQIQEMTLTFVPKIGLMLAVFWVSMSFMTAILAGFFTDSLLPLMQGG